MTTDRDAPPSDPTHQIGARAVRGFFYSSTAPAVTLSLGFIRAVLLARLLSPAHFGIPALALLLLTHFAGINGAAVDLMAVTAAALFFRQVRGLKVFVISVIFGGVLWFTERDQLRTGIEAIWRVVRPA